MPITQIPELDEEQTRQLVSDLHKKTSEKELQFWKDAITNARKIGKKLDNKKVQSQGL